MAIVKMIYVVCDRCGAESSDTQGTVAKARADHLKGGGRTINGQDICWECLDTEKYNEAVRQEQGM